jgi:hypothetical protein
MNEHRGDADNFKLLVVGRCAMEGDGTGRHGKDDICFLEVLSQLAGTPQEYILQSQFTVHA